MKSKHISFTAEKSRAWIHSGIRDYQLYAEIPHSDALVAVLELNEDCPGTCYTYFMRGGIEESRMSFEEMLRGAESMIDLAVAAKTHYPNLFYERTT